MTSDGKPCDHVFTSGRTHLTCDLRLVLHEIHHDPEAGLWWTECALHSHTKGGEEDVQPERRQQRRGSGA